MVTGQPAHLAQDALEVAALHGQDLGERALAALEVVGEEHLAHGVDAIALEEHVLGAAEADALGAERAREARLLRAIGVGADAEPARLVRPGHEASELGTVRGGRAEGHSPRIDLAARPIDGELGRPRRRPAATRRVERRASPAARSRS